MAVEGLDKLLRRMERLQSPAMRRDLSKALFAGGDIVRVEAQRSLTNGAVSGKNHVPSIAGEPPNQDSGTLGGNIETRQISSEEVEVSSDAEYSAALEYGTSKMAARPFMRPARDKAVPQIEALLVKVINKHNRS